MSNDFILTKPFESKSYAEFASECNLAGRVIEDRGTYLEGVVVVEHEATYAELRSVAYPDLTEQLDKLYHDIDGGLFGESAKISAFYLARKEVKDEYPKE